MRKRKFGPYKIMAAILLTGAVLTGCGGSREDNSASAGERSYMSAMSVQDMDVEEMDVETAERSNTSESAGGMAENTDGGIQAQQRKLIKDIGISAETKDCDKLLGELEKKTTELGGYVEYLDSNIKPYEGSTNQHIEMTVRIPVEDVSRFIATLEDLASITARREHVQDVTMEYVDLESRKKMLLAEQESLLKLLVNASGLDEIIKLEERISEVRYQVERMEAQLRTYNNLIEYSKINLYIEEVEEIIPIEKMTSLGRIQTGFTESVGEIGAFFKELGIGFLIKIPYFIVFAIVAAAIFLIGKMIVRKRVRRKVQQEQGKQVREEPENSEGSTK